MDIKLTALGYIESEYNIENKPPRQSFLNQDKSAFIRIKEEFQPAMLGLEKGDLIMVTFYFHKASLNQIQHISHVDGKMKGVFATRSPERFTRLGHSIVKIKEIRDNGIEILGVDMLNETPVLDIKKFGLNFIPE